MADPTVGLFSMLGVIVGAGISLLGAYWADRRKAQREHEQETRRLRKAQCLEQIRCFDEFERLTAKMIHQVLSPEQLETTRCELAVLGAHVDFAFCDEALAKEVASVLTATYDAKRKNWREPLDAMLVERRERASAEMRRLAKALRERVVS